MKKFQTCIFLFVILEATANALTPQNCQIDTRNNKNAQYTFLLRITENTNNIPNVVFKIGATNIALHDTIPMYVNINVGNVNSLACSFIGEGVVVTNVISRLDAVITILRGDSASLFHFETKRIKITHDKDNRNFVPVNVKVLKGTAISTEIILFANGRKEADINLKEDAENWFVIPKEEVGNGDSFEMIVTMPIDGQIIITNLQEEKPAIVKDKPTTLTCFAKSCSFEITKEADQENVLMEVELYSDPGEDVSELEVGAKIKETMDLQMGEVQIIKDHREELNPTLECVFSSTLKDVSQPPTILIFNFKKTDKLMLKKKKMVIRSRPTSGTFVFDRNEPQTTLKLELLATSTALRCNLRFSIINPLAELYNDFYKSIQLTKKKTNAILNFFEDQVDPTTYTSEFELQNALNARISVRIEPILFDFEEIKVGRPGSLEKPKIGIIRKPTSDITLILQLASETTIEEANVIIGEEEVSVEKMAFYYYMYQSTFGSSTELQVIPETPNALVKYSRIDRIVPFPIKLGSQIVSQSGDFKLRIQNPAIGATVKVKGSVETVKLIKMELVFKSKEPNGKTVKRIRDIHGAFEEIIFIYPEDLNGATEVDGNLNFDKDVKVFVDNTAGIEEITIESGNWIVRKNPVKLSIQRPNVDNIIEIHLEDDSQADSVVFKFNGQKHTVDKTTRLQTVALSKEFLKANPSPEGFFTTNPSHLDGHININIRPGKVPLIPPTRADPPILKDCDPECQGNRECLQGANTAQCVCKPGYQGINCEKKEITNESGNWIVKKHPVKLFNSKGFYTTNPSHLDGHITINIRPGKVPLIPPTRPDPPILKDCDPECQGNRECLQGANTAQCVCKPGYQGINCEKTQNNGGSGGYNCANNNPCSPSLIIPNKFHYQHTNSRLFVQCSQSGQCYEMKCPLSLRWKDLIQSCV